MVADFTKPNDTSLNYEFDDEIREMFEALCKLSIKTALNPPDGAVHYDATTRVFERWNANDSLWRHMSIMPAGVVMQYAGANIPEGWLECAGQIYPTNWYPTLFSAIGYTYGGTGGNFQLPDLRGKFPLGFGGPGVSSSRGNTGGSLDHTHTITHSHSVASHVHTMGAHTHTVLAHNHRMNHHHGIPAHYHSSQAPGADIAASGGDHSHISNTLYTNDPNHVHASSPGTLMEGVAAAGASAYGATSSTSGVSLSNSNFTGSVGNVVSGNNGDDGTLDTGIPSTQWTEDTAPETGGPSTNTTEAAGATTDSQSVSESGPGNPPYLVLKMIIKW